MRENYWYFLTDMKFKECYYEHYRIKDAFYDNLFTFAGLILSAGGLAALFTQMGFSFFAALMIFLGQAVSLVNHKLPYAQRIQAAGCILSELPHLVKEVEADWLRLEMGGVSAEELPSLLDKHEKAYAGIERRFEGLLPWPRKKRVIAEAEAETEAFLNLRFGVLTVAEGASSLV